MYKNIRLVNLDDLLLSINSAFDTKTANIVTEYIKDYPTIEPENKFKEYFMELYGDGLEVSNWHLNGDTELLDSFIDSAIEFEEE